MHKNLFHGFEDRRAVYRKLNEDQASDQKWLDRYQSIAALAAIGVVSDAWHLRYVSLVALIYILVTGQRIWSDMSNRNFMMHMIDWQANIEQ